MDLVETDYFFYFTCGKNKKIMSLLSEKELLNISLVSKYLKKIALRICFGKMFWSGSKLRAKLPIQFNVNEFDSYYKQFIKYKHQENKWLKNDYKKDVFDEIQNKGVDGSMLPYVFGVSTDFKCQCVQVTDFHVFWSAVSCAD